MQDNKPAVFQQDMYVPNRWTRFLWWLATAEEDLIRDCVVDRNRYAITGMTVMGTWLFATLAWAYFFSTVTGSLPAALLLGIFMGGIILTIDRALIKGISRSNKKKAIPFLFRALLAFTIGLFMAQPALLYLFNKEIHVQISLDNEQRKKDKRMQQDTVNAAAKNELLKKKNDLQLQLSDKYQEVSAARIDFITETDGTGGSRKRGLKDIAQAKQNEYKKLDAEYAQMQSALQPQLKTTDSALNALEAAIQKEQQAFETLLNDGFITRIEALNHLVQNNSAVAFRYYLLVLILMLIELMPVIAKTLLPDGTYDEKIRLREQIEKTLTQKNHERELALKELHNQTAFEHDGAFIKDFFQTAEQERREKMKSKFSNWKEENSDFNILWDELKKEMLTKQEQ